MLVLRRYPAFRLLWSGQTVSAVGDQILPLAVVALLLGRHDDAGLVGVVFAGRALALVLCLLAGGVLADRLPRRQIMMIADLARFALVGVVALTAATVPSAVLVALTFLVGAGEALSKPAFRALAATLVEPADLNRVNAMMTLSSRLSIILGMLCGAGLITLTGPGAAFGIDAATFLFSIATLYAVREVGVPRAGAGERPWAAALGGLRVVGGIPWILAGMAVFCLQLLFAAAPAQTLLPIVLSGRPHPASAYGLVLAAQSLGALPAVYVTSRWRPSRPGLVSMLSLVCYAAVPLSMLGGGNLPLLLGGYAVGGFAVALAFVYWSSALVEGVPGEYLGRVLAVDQLAAFALTPAGLAATGPLVAVLGDRPVLVTAAVVTVLSSLVALAVPGVSRFKAPDPAGAAQPSAELLAN